jgi:glyoxylase-like metal-dependent hydrolase (beta-lactamase superfamily II)
MRAVPKGLHPVSAFLVNCHVLVDEHGRVVVIDSGFVGSRKKFENVFTRLGLKASAVDAILLTHGHLDHTANLAWLKEWTGAPVFAHPLEQQHIDGTWPYRGISRVCGWMEAAGRRLVRYEPIQLDRTFSDNDRLPFWGGLRVVHLPGHSAGHCGFWSERNQLLFIGDLAAIWTWRTTFPPPIFNSQPELLRASLRRAAALNPEFVVPNHYNRFDPRLLAEWFCEFARKKGMED